MDRDQRPVRHLALDDAGVGAQAPGREELEQDLVRRTVGLHDRLAFEPVTTAHDAELDAMVAELRVAGLLTIGADAHGRETWTLTPQGAQVATRWR